MIITSVTNEKIKYLIKLNQKKYREDSYLIEGVHLVEEAHKLGLVKQVILLAGKDLDINVEKIYVTENVMRKISLTDNVPSVMALVHKTNNNKIGNKVIMLDDISDPGNLGTIIRSAVAFNFDTIVLSKNTVDPYNSKVLRSTGGMFYNINIIIDDLVNVINKLKDENYKIVGTKVDLGKDVCDFKKIEKFALIMGNEARGINKQIESLCDDFINIKMNEKCESLNVSISASIIMYELDK